MCVVHDTTNTQLTMVKTVFDHALKVQVSLSRVLFDARPKEVLFKQPTTNGTNPFNLLIIVVPMGKLNWFFRDYICIHIIST